VFITYEAEVSRRVSGGERGVVDFGKLFTETNEQKGGKGGGEMTSQNLRPRHVRHFVGITWRNVWS